MLVLVGCAVLFAYALINLINVMYGKMDEEQKSLGNTSGAGRHAPADLPQFFLECLTLVLAAVVLIFLMEPLIYQLVKGVLTTTLACIRSLQCSSCRLFPRISSVWY